MWVDGCVWVDDVCGWMDVWVCVVFSMGGEGEGGERGGEGMRDVPCGIGRLWVDVCGCGVLHVGPWEGNRREGKEGKGRDGNRREGKGREGMRDVGCAMGDARWDP